MGQAKQRGTFEQRRELATARNLALTEHVKTDARSSAFVKRYGAQRFATRLVAAGILINNPVIPQTKA